MEHQFNLELDASEEASAPIKPPPQQPTDITDAPEEQRTCIGRMIHPPKRYQPMSSFLEAMDTIEDLFVDPVSCLTDAIHPMGLMARKIDADAPKYPSIMRQCGALIAMNSTRQCY